MVLKVCLFCVLFCFVFVFVLCFMCVLFLVFVFGFVLCFSFARVVGFISVRFLQVPCKQYAGDVRVQARQIFDLA